MTDEKKQAVPTTFFILEHSGDGIWKYAGQVEARDRYHAARVFYGDSADEAEVTFVAVSVSAWKPRVRKAIVKSTVTYEEVEPSFRGPEPLPVETPDLDPNLSLVPPAA